jgi:hypothetical protein
VEELETTQCVLLLIGLNHGLGGGSQGKQLAHTFEEFEAAKGYWIDPAVLVARFSHFLWFGWLPFHEAGQLSNERETRSVPE